MLFCDTSALMKRELALTFGLHAHDSL